MLAAPAQTRAQSQLPFLARQLRSSLPRLQFFPGGTCTWGGHLRRGKRLDVGRDLLEGTVCSKQVGTEGSLLVRQLFLEPLRLQKIKHPDDQQTPFRMLARIAPCSLMLLGAVTRAPAMQSPSTGSKQLSTRSRGKPAHFNRAGCVASSQVHWHLVGRKRGGSGAAPPAMFGARNGQRV